MTVVSGDKNSCVTTYVHEPKLTRLDDQCLVGELTELSPLTIMKVIESPIAEYANQSIRINSSSPNEFIQVSLVVLNLLAAKLS